MVKLANGNFVIVDTDNEFEIDFNNLKKAITINTRGILINSPNNPTGKIYDK